jgi:hypothetical protein
VRVYTCSNTGERLYLPFILREFGTVDNAIINGDFESGVTGWTEYSTHDRPLIMNGLPPAPD